MAKVVVVASGKHRSRDDETYGALVTALSKSNQDTYVSFDFHFSQLLKRNFWTYTRMQRVLFSTEPKTVRPKQYGKLPFLVFAKVFDRSYEDSDRGWKGGVPPLFRPKIEGPILPSNFDDNLVMIVGNKKSFVPGSLYRARLELLAKLAPSFRAAKLYGRGWNSPMVTFKDTIYQLIVAVSSGVAFRLRHGLFTQKIIEAVSNVSICGEVHDPLRVFSGHEFALVIENEASYLSEKLFAPMAAGAKILYFGAPLPQYLMSNYPVVLIDENSDLDQKVRDLKNRSLNSRSTESVKKFFLENRREKCVMIATLSK